MIERIDLIEKEPFKFTYKKIMQAGGVALLICFLLLGTLMFRSFYYKKKISKIQNSITALKEEFNELNKNTPPQLEQGSQSELKNIFSNTPKWGQLIQDLSSRLPGNVWLTDLKGQAKKPVIAVTSSKKDSDKKKDKKNKDKNKTEEAESKTRDLILNGYSITMPDLATFVKSLQQSPYLNRVILTSSKLDKVGFTFTVECDMVPTR